MSAQPPAQDRNNRAIVGWPAELLAEIATALSRRVAAALLTLSASAIETLADDKREMLLEAIQDTIAELPDDLSENNTASPNAAATVRKTLISGCTEQRSA
jgi:hypothetical protein